MAYWAHNGYDNRSSLGTKFQQATFIAGRPKANFCFGSSRLLYMSVALSVINILFVMLFKATHRTKKKIFKNRVRLFKASLA